MVLRDFGHSSLYFFLSVILTQSKNIPRLLEIWKKSLYLINAIVFLQYGLQNVIFYQNKTLNATLEVLSFIEILKLIIILIFLRYNYNEGPTNSVIGRFLIAPAYLYIYLEYCSHESLFFPFNKFQKLD